MIDIDVRQRAEITTEQKEVLILLYRKLQKDFGISLDKKRGILTLRWRESDVPKEVSFLITHIDDGLEKHTHCDSCGEEASSDIVLREVAVTVSYPNGSKNKVINELSWWLCYDCACPK